MAAAIENPNPLMPQDILNEVHKFLQGTSSKGNVNSEALTQSALFLLRTVPVARHAVLEHFFNVFDEAVHEHLLQMQIGHTVTDERAKDIESILRDISGVLLSFIQTNPEAWAPILSSWSLELLGHVSCKYAKKRGIPHSNSLNEILQVWMTCRPTQLLMELATECFSAMVGGAPDKCVDALLEASVKYSPHFDWVVAHIGSCFPKMIITRVLNCGLKDFCSAENDPAGRDASARMKIPKMASVVGILGHLASKHGQDIRQALMNLFENSLQGDCSPVKVTTVPFLLQLASMSPMLLHVLTTDMIKSLTPAVLNKLHRQFASWKKTNSQEYYSLLSLVVHLAIKTDTGSFDVLHFLVTTASPKVHSDDMDVECPEKEVQETCCELMNKLLQEMQRLVHCKKRDPAACDIPLITGLTPSISKLVDLLMESEGQSVVWLQKLLICVALYCGQASAASILAGVIAHAKRTPQSIVFLRLQKGIETAFPDIITVTVEHVVSLLLPHNTINHLQLLKNLLFLVQWEKKTESFKNKTTSSRLRHCLQEHITSLSSLLLHPDQDISVSVLSILGHINIPTKLSATTLSQLCSTLSFTCFRIIQISDSSLMLRRIRLCKNCCRQVQLLPMAKSMLLQILMEGSVVSENALLFGGKPQQNLDKDTNTDRVSLLEENRKNAFCLTSSRLHSSVFHAGVIGQGLKPRLNAEILSKDIVKRNIRTFLDILWTCAQERKTECSDETTDSGQHLLHKEMNGPAAKTMATTLVNFATPDVLYNDIIWPDEEFLRISLERDLLVWKKFDSHPVLWDLLCAFCSSAVFTFYMSPVIRCLLGAVINHYDSIHDKAMRNSPKQYEAACKLIYCLGCSGILPKPLSNISEIFYYATPYEGHLLLIGVWRYIKENPFTWNKQEIEKRKCDDKFTAVISSVIHSNVDTMGHLYSRFFDTVQP